MVLSRITSRVDYDEYENIHSEDIGHESSLYESVLFKQKVILTLGKVKFTHIDKGVVYFPIYLVSDRYKIIEQIGVHEINKNSFLDRIQEDSDEIDMSLFHEAIIFEKTERIIEKMYAAGKKRVKDTIVLDTKVLDTKVLDTKVLYTKAVDTKVVDEEVMNVIDNFELGIDKSCFTKVDTEINKTLKEGLFTKHDREKTSLLSDELKETAEQITKSYHHSANDNWIKKMMKNPNYEVKDVDVENSFFTVIKNAFEQIGHYTTVKKLRSIVAKHTPEKFLIENRLLFSEYNAQVEQMRRRLLEIKRIIEVDLRGKIQDTVITKVEQKSIIDKCATLKKEFDRINKLKKDISKIILDTFGKDFDTITSLEKYKEFIVSGKYFVNSNAISLIERELNIKTIIFSDVDHDDANEVIISNKQIDGKINYKPDYYVLCSVKQGVYKSVSYKGKTLLEFSEIPYHIKVMIVKKSMSGIAGNFSHIEDFKNYSSLLGIKQVKPTEESESNINNMEVLYDPSIKLMFYSKSSNKNAGEGSGDCVDISNIQLFSVLSSIEDWRKKLDDSWIDLDNPFTINNKKYASVVHYYQGSKYKNSFPEFAHQFSLDSGSKISKDLSMCNNASSVSGSMIIKNDTIQLRPKVVKVDPDFFKGRNVIERQTAIDAKFKQNSHLRDILVNTKKAQLNHYIGNKLPEISIALMKTRLSI